MPGSSEATWNSALRSAGDASVSAEQVADLGEVLGGTRRTALKRAVLDSGLERRRIGRRFGEARRAVAERVRAEGGVGRPVAERRRACGRPRGLVGRSRIWRAEGLADAPGTVGADLAAICGARAATEEVRRADVGGGEEPDRRSPRRDRPSARTS